MHPESCPELGHQTNAAPVHPDVGSQIHDTRHGDANVAPGYVCTYTHADYRPGRQICVSSSVRPMSGLTARMVRTLTARMRNRRIGVLWYVHVCTDSDSKRFRKRCHQNDFVSQNTRTLGKTATERLVSIQRYPGVCADSRPGRARCMRSACACMRTCPGARVVRVSRPGRRLAGACASAWTRTTFVRTPRSSARRCVRSSAARVCAAGVPRGITRRAARGISRPGARRRAAGASPGLSSRLRRDLEIARDRPGARRRAAGSTPGGSRRVPGRRRRPALPGARRRAAGRFHENAPRVRDLADSMRTRPDLESTRNNSVPGVAPGRSVTNARDPRLCANMSAHIRARVANVAQSRGNSSLVSFVFRTRLATFRLCFSKRTRYGGSKC